MMQEKLTLHQEEWKVVERPPKHGSTDFVVKPFVGHLVVVLEASLPPQDRKALEGEINSNGDCGCPPYDGVTEEVYLAIVSAPEIDSTA